MTNENMKNLDFSIIIPVYNAASYLNDCINSVLAQEGIDKEIICIDDGSTDESLDIINEYSRDYENIIVLKQNHKGAGEARNNGLRHAKGKYIAFLDADDFYLDKFALRKLKDMCEKTGLKICCSALSVMENDVVSEFDIFESAIEGDREIDRIDFCDIQNDFYYQAYIFDRSFLSEHNIFFPDYKRYQDPPFLLRALHDARFFCYAPVKLYCYRYGHQDLDIVIKNLVDVMKGIRETLEIAIEGNYRQLIEKIIKRINYDYYEPVLYNISDELLLVLADISRKLTDYDSSYKVEQISFLRDSYKGHLDLMKYSGELRNDVENKWRIITVLNSMVDAFLDNKMETYFADRGIRKVVIYGVGDYGKKLIKMLRKTSMEVVGLIDRKLDEYDGIIVIKPGAPVPECDCLVVSMMNYSDVVDYYRSSLKVPVYALVQILEELNL
jgi:glycosyltransferase involved in cell wall biosynthesis